MTSQKEKALAALLTYPTRKEAAKAAGITDRTMRGYLQDKEFREAYRAAYNDVVEDATRKAQLLMGKAMGVFESVMDDTSESGTTRTQAAAKAMEYALRLTEQTDVVTELAELRKAVFPDES